MKVLGYGSRLAGRDDSTKLGGLEPKIKEIVEIKQMTIIGCGSSLNAANFAIKYFRYLCCFQSINTIESSEFTEHDLP